MIKSLIYEGLIMALLGVLGLISISTLLGVIIGVGLGRIVVGVIEDDRK